MATLAWISFVLLLVATIEQIGAVAVFLRYCRRKPRPAVDYQPAVLVILPVRGADETLANCIEALTRQDYANFRVRVILDSDTDPGWQVVGEVLEREPSLPMEVMKLQEVHPRCTLKCSSVYEATENLDDAEIVALLDSDIVPHQTWLSELVAPLAEDEVGVATGNRWYLPDRCQWGSMLCYCWNAAAIVAMYIWGMPWGGTLAIKRRVLEETDIRERWLRAGCEDVPLVQALRDLGLQVRFLPSLIMVDREETHVKHCLPFLDRQLLWARLYYPACWWACNVWQLLTTLAMLTIGCYGALGLLRGQFAVFLAAVAALTISTGVSLLLIKSLESHLVPHEQGPATQRPWKTFWAIVLTHAVMVRVILVSLFTRATNWRGIDYRVDGPWQIELVKYRPYAEQSSAVPEPDLAGASPLP